MKRRMGLLFSSVLIGGSILFSSCVNAPTHAISYQQMDKTFADIDYVPYKYFLLTRLPYFSGGVTTGQLSSTVVYPTALPQNYSEQIWVDPANGLAAPPGNPNFMTYAGGVMEHWIPGRDYTIDYTTGIITFLRTLSPIMRIAVAFTTQGGNSIGFASPGNIDMTTANLQVDPVGVVSTGAHLIKDNVNPAYVPPNYLLNYFDLGKGELLPPASDPNFLFEVRFSGTNNLLQAGEGVTVSYPSSQPWIYSVDASRNLLTVTNFNFYDSSARSPVNGFYFPERPFANLDSAAGTGTNDVYSPTTTPISQNFIHIKYKLKWRVTR